jgi:prepilin-type N-terminal cleavage/methylation domain-containing protein
MVNHRKLSRDSGFTLIELVLVITILIVLFGVAVPALQSDDRAGNAARTLVSDASRARSYSKRTWEDVTLQIDVGNNRWRTQLQDGTSLATYQTDSTGWSNLPPGLVFSNVTGYDSDATFLPTGRTTNHVAFSIAQDHHQWRIEINSLSGLITATPQ